MMMMFYSPISPIPCRWLFDQRVKLLFVMHVLRERMCGGDNVTVDDDQQ